MEYTSSEGLKQEMMVQKLLMSNIKANASSSVKRHMVSVCAFVRPTEVKIDILRSILVIVGTAMFLLAILGIGIMY